MTVWHLELARGDELRPPDTSLPWATIVPLLRPSTGLARFLYETIGEDSGWRSRRGWDDAEWRAELDRPGCELWMSWQCGRPTGYAELNGGRGPGRATTRIVYLGLLPEFRGIGLGGQLLTDVAQRARTQHLRTPSLPPVERVEVDTSSCDSASALPNYCARGFRVVDCEQRWRDVSGSGAPRREAPARARR